MYSGWHGKYRSEEARRAHSDDPFSGAAYMSPEEAERRLRQLQRIQDEQRARAGEVEAAHRIPQANDVRSVARSVVVVLLPLFLALLVLVFLVVFAGNGGIGDGL